MSRHSTFDLFDFDPWTTKNKMKKRCDRFCCYSPSAPPTEGPTDRQLASFQSHTDWQITNQKKILNWRVTMSAHLQALQGEVPEASAPVSFFFLLFSSPPTKKKKKNPRDWQLKVNQVPGPERRVICISPAGHCSNKGRSVSC